MDYIWTSHAKYKMNFYRLSEARVKRVISNPARIEEGIADDTVAMMQPAGTKNNPYEIWTMISKSKLKNPWPGRQRSKLRVPSVKVISAWRYPGVTKAGEALPREILAELRSAIR
ncbi:MAG: hypothetical protein A3B23_00285 [Candidatus Colwellbacteria bacterium RIFCSPLOWO2_01_FULL_48_10]|uniref:Uncharacterized protein n=1 Tax=Candidatus Colwellbacteria bacterium RIFCSPLOWO2_01_FULL_48_10 TaxID=1797690 RepID=A0A1G1Z5E9_9BACT|nr:MAG: hypothetical protein A3B23_00285 [Candidatus Colwellbacteria bacterium RIFCSPLOWO2_01_FULL_48_10]